MASDVELREAFSLLHPLCAQLSSNPSVECLTKLRQAVLSVAPEVVDELQEFVLFAFRVLFKTLRSRPEKFRIEFFQCLNALLSQSKDIVEGSLFYELVNSVVLNICPPLPNGPQTDDICEELKLEGVMTLDLLFSNASLEVLQRFYRLSSSLPFLGHAVSVLLAFLENEKLRILRSASIRALLRLSLCCVEGPHCNLPSTGDSGTDPNSLANQEQRTREKFCPIHRRLSSDHDDGIKESSIKELTSLVGNVFASFLPGISMTLTKVAVGDPKQGQMVMSYSVAAFSRILVRTFSDELLESSIGKQVTLEGEKESHRELLVSKTDEWMSGTSKKLQFLVERIVSVASTDDRWRVRLELLKMSELLLVNCCRSLSGSSEKLLNVVISGIVDEEPIVQRTARQVFQSLSVKVSDESGRGASDLIDSLEENFLGLVEDLPTLLNSSSDHKKLAGLRLLHGHLQMLGERSSFLMLNDFLMEKFLRSLFVLLEFDCSTLVVCDNAGEDLQPLKFGSMDDRLPPYPFRRFSDERISDEVIRCLNLIGRLWNLGDMTNQLLGSMVTFRKFKKESAFCLIHVLHGARTLVGDSKVEESQLDYIVGCIIGQVLDSTFWTRACEPPRVVCERQVSKVARDMSSRLTIVEGRSDATKEWETRKGSNQGQSLRETREETTFACLLLDVVGASALLAGPTFEPRIQDILVPVLERVGSSRPDVRARALRCLCDIARATSIAGRVDDDREGEGGAVTDPVAEMLMRCSDYLMSSVIPGLRTMASDPGVLVALAVVVELGTPKFDPGVFSLSPSSLYDLTPHRNMMHIMNSSFKQIITSFDRHHRFYCLEFWRLLQRVAQLVSRTVLLEKVTLSSSSKADISKDSGLETSPTTTSSEGGSESDDPTRSRTTDPLVEYVRELEKNRRIMESREDEQEEGDDGATGDVYERMMAEKEKMEAEIREEEEEKKVDVPYYVPMLEQILDRCQHFLIFPDARIRSMALEVISIICPTLKPFQDNLLPLVHKVWTTFVRRFSDEEHFVCIRAFKTLRVVADSAGDFVRRRVVKDVVPRVVDLLTSLAKKSHKAPPPYKFSTGHQLQKCVLKSIGDICRQAGIEGPPLCSLVGACIPYLSALQPVSLQEACLMTFREFMAIDPDVVWLLLTGVYHPTAELVPPAGSDLLPIKLKGPNKRNEFTDNVVALYKVLEQQ